MVHPAVRPTALVLALVPAYLLLVGVSNALGGEPILGAAQIVVNAIALGILAWFVASPERAAASLAWPAGADLQAGSSVTGYFVQAFIVYVFFGLLTIVQGAFVLEQLLETGGHPSEGAPLVEADLLFSQSIVFTMLIIGAVSWVVLVERPRRAGAARALGLAPLRPLETVIGVLAGGVGYYLLLVLLVLGFQLSGAEDPVNPQADALAEALSPAGMVALAVMAGVGEELYFRGLLAPRLGNLRQAVLFGVVHVSYLTPWQVLIPFVVGYGFGFLRARVGLWAPILLHVGFDVLAFFGNDLANRGQEIVRLLGGA